VALGEAGNGNTEITRILFVDVFDEVDCIVETSGSGLPSGRAGGRITTKGKDVLTPVFFRLLQVSDTEDDSTCL